MSLLSTSTVFDGGAMALQLGGELAHLELAYETWGTLSKDNSNAILICHGYTNTPHAAGWWSGLIGAGKALDTDRWFVVCCNMPGSAYGSSGPPSMNPDTGKPYGPDFPELTLADMANAQDRLLRSLGIEQLAAIVGYSFGGQLALQWATANPLRMNCLVVVASGLRTGHNPDSAHKLEQRFAGCDGWSDGHYLQTGDNSGDNERNIRDELRQLRLETLRAYGFERHLADRLNNDEQLASQMNEIASQWAKEFDANAMIALRKAQLRFDATPLVDNIQAPLLYVLSRTDAVYPPTLATPTMELLKAAGKDSSYFEIDSEYGHFAPSADWHLWGDELSRFIDKHNQNRMALT
jgi:homoserine O-acetyltransferase